MSHAPSSPLSRRTVFAGVGTVGALAAVAAVLPGAPDLLPKAQAGLPSATPDQGGGYQVTQHVLRYYQTTRI